MAFGLQVTTATPTQCTLVNITTVTTLVTLSILLLCSFINVGNFVRWNRTNTTVFILTGVAALEVLVQLFRLTIEIFFATGYSQEVAGLLKTLYVAALAFDTAEALVLLMTVAARLRFIRMHLRRTTPNLTALTMQQVKIRFVAVVIFAIALHLPFGFLASENIYKFGALGAWYFMYLNVARSLSPGFGLLIGGVILLIFNLKKPTLVDATIETTRDDVILQDISTEESEFTTEEDARSSTLEKELTIAVLVIAFVLGIAKACAGISFEVAAFNFNCSNIRVAVLTDYIVFAMNVVPFLTYVVILSEYRAQFCACLRAS